MSKFKIDKDVPPDKLRSPFTIALDTMEVGDSIGGLTREEVYKYRPNFYAKHFKDRKFSFKPEDEEGTTYRIWRIK